MSTEDNNSVSTYQSQIDQYLSAKQKIAGSSSLISLWAKWYKGKVPNFHNYTIYNGSNPIKLSKKSLGMAKKVSEDWASLLMNEKVQIVVKDNEQLDTLLTELNAWKLANKSVELGFSLSLSCLVLGIEGLVVDDEAGIIKDKSKTKLTLDVISALKIIPITFEKGKLVEAAFVTNNTNGATFEIHKRDKNGNYHIINVNADSNGKFEKAVDFNTLSTKPWFFPVYPNIVNNLELDTPYSISIYANSIDTLKAIDTAYDSYDNEFVNGRKRIFISTKLFTVDKVTGEQKQTFDPHDTVFYQLPELIGANGEMKELIHSITDPLRVIEHNQKMQDELNYLSSKVGLGVDYYRFEKGRVMTATQVISEKSDTFRNMKKHEIVLEQVLIDMTRAIMEANNNFTDKPQFSDTESVIIKFDDSIIEDKESEKTSDRTDLTNGVISKVDYRAKWLGEDLETAEKYITKHFGNQDLINRANAYGGLLGQQLITVRAYVNLTFTDEDIKAMGYETKDALIEEMTQAIKDANSITPQELGGYMPPINQ